MIIYLKNTSQVTGYALKPLVFHHTGLVEGRFVAVINGQCLWTQHATTTIFLV